MEMRNYLTRVIPALITALVLWSCSDNDKWGSAKIYIPQAVIVDGGITNEYPVPLNNNSVTKNYSIDSDGKLKVTLGVYRSGLQELLSYSVKVSVDTQATDDAIAAASNRILLPDGYWSMPSSVTVPDGEREAIYFLEVDLPRLKNDFPDYHANKLVLGVRISEPSRYVLNEDISTAVVVIDGATFFDAPEMPELVLGGQLQDGDDQYWNYANIQNAPEGSGFMVIGGGKLVIDSSPISVDHLAEYWTELAEELTEGATYTFTMEVTTDGNASKAELNIGIAPDHSDDGRRYGIKDFGNGYYFCTIDTWSDPWLLSSPFDGIMPRDAGTWMNGFVSGSNEFVAGKGQKYLCIQACTWGGSLGKITIQNITIREKRN